MVNYDENGTPKKNKLSLQIDLSKFEPATDEEKKQQDVMSKSSTFFKDGMKKLRKNPLAMASMIVLVLIIVLIIVAPLVIPYGYSEILSVNGKRDKGAKNLAPFTYSKMEQKYIDEGNYRFPHVFGTDEQCRDYFVRVIYGTRVSLVVGFFASLIVLIIGMIYGSISGYLGGYGRLDHDENSRYHILASGHADGHPAVGRVQGSAGFPGRVDSGEAGHQHGFPVHCLRTSLLGRNGKTDPRADSFHQGK
jgi:hypothetical protein